MMRANPATDETVMTEMANGLLSMKDLLWLVISPLKFARAVEDAVGVTEDDVPLVSVGTCDDGCAGGRAGEAVGVGVIVADVAEPVAVESEEVG